MSSHRRFLESLQQLGRLPDQLSDTILTCEGPLIARALLAGKTCLQPAGWVSPANIGSKPGLSIQVTKRDGECKVVRLVVSHLRQHALNSEMGAIE